MPNDFNFDFSDFNRSYRPYNYNNRNDFGFNPNNLLAGYDESGIQDPSSMGGMENLMQQAVQLETKKSFLSLFLGPIIGGLIGKILERKFLKNIENMWSGGQSGGPDASGPYTPYGANSGNQAANNYNTPSANSEAGIANASSAIDKPIVPAWQTESIVPSSSQQKKANKKAGRDAFGVDYLSDKTVDAANTLKSTTTSFWDKVKETGVKDEDGNPAFNLNFIDAEIKSGKYNDLERDALKRFKNHPDEYKFFADENGLISQEALEKGLFKNKYGSDGLAKAENDFASQKQAAQDQKVANEAAAKAQTVATDKAAADQKRTKEEAKSEQFEKDLNTIRNSEELFGNSKGGDRSIDAEYAMGVISGHYDSVPKNVKEALGRVYSADYKWYRDQLVADSKSENPDANDGKGDINLKGVHYYLANDANKVNGYGDRP